MSKLQSLHIKQAELEQIIELCKGEIKHAEMMGLPDVASYHSAQNRLSLAEAEYKDVVVEIQTTEAQAEEIEHASAEVQSEIDAELEDVNGVNVFELLCSLADPNQEQDPKAAYEFIKGYIKDKAVDIATTHTIISQSYKSEIESLQSVVSEVSQLRSQLEDYDKTNADQANTIIRLDNEVYDLNAKRDAAALEIDELKQDNERLKEDSATLRKRIEELSSNTGGYLKTSGLAAQLKKEPIQIYNLEWENDLKRTRYKANLAATGEVIFIPHYAINSYKVLEGEELARFQADNQSQQVEQVTEPIHEEVELQTPSLEQDANIQPIEGSAVSGEVVPEAEAVTREEFEALKQQVIEVRGRLGM